MSWPTVALILGLVGEIVSFLASSMWAGAYERAHKNETN